MASPVPESLLQGRRFAFTSGVPKLLGTPQHFRRAWPERGAGCRTVLPDIAAIADDLCFIKSMHTDQFNHAPAELLLVHRLAAVWAGRRWARG